MSDRLLAGVRALQGPLAMASGLCLLCLGLVLSASPGVRADGGAVPAIGRGEPSAPETGVAGVDSKRESGPVLDLLWEVRSPVPGARVVRTELADLDGDGLLDLVLSSVARDGPWWTVALDGENGETMWARAHEVRPVVRVARVTGGGSCVVAAAGAGVEVIDGPTGEVLERAGLYGVIGDMAVGDLDGDGAQDVVCVSGFERDDALVALSGEGLRQIMSVRALEDESSFGTGFGRPVVADADGDGRGEVYLSENTDSLTRIDSDGTRAWTVLLDERRGLLPRGAVTGGPDLADVTGDGSAEVFAGCLAGRLIVLAASTGDTVSVRRFGLRSREVSARVRRLPRALRAAVAGSGEPVNDPLPIELDGRPGLDLVFGCSDRLVHAFSPSRGVELWRFECGGKVHDRPAAVDWDADGKHDVLVWHDQAAYVVDGGSGVSLPGLPRIDEPDDVLLADLDGDGLMELTAVERGARRVAVWKTELRVGAARGETR